MWKKHRRMGYTEEKIKSILYKMSLYDEFMEEYNCRKRNSNKIEKVKRLVTEKIGEENTFISCHQ